MLTMVLSLGKKGAYPEDSHILYCHIQLASREPFMCLDLINKKERRKKKEKERKRTRKKAATIKETAK